MEKSKILISLILTQILFISLIIINHKISIAEAKKDKGGNNIVYAGGTIIISDGGKKSKKKGGTIIIITGNGGGGGGNNNKGGWGSSPQVMPMFFPVQLAWPASTWG